MYEVLGCEFSEAGSSFANSPLSTDFEREMSAALKVHYSRAMLERDASGWLRKVNFAAMSNESVHGTENLRELAARSVEISLMFQAILVRERGDQVTVVGSARSESYEGSH